MILPEALSLFSSGYQVKPVKLQMVTLGPLSKSIAKTGTNHSRQHLLFMRSFTKFWALCIIIHVLLAGFALYSYSFDFSQVKFQYVNKKQYLL